MNATPARILLKLLTDAGIVKTPATASMTVWGGYVGPLPADPKRAIGFTDYGADQYGQIQRTGEPVRFWRVQIMVRSLDYNAGGQYANVIDAYLRRVGGYPPGGLGSVGVTVGSETLIVDKVTPLAALMYLAKNDEDSTHLWVLNERFGIRVQA